TSGTGSTAEQRPGGARATAAAAAWACRSCRRSPGPTAGRPRWSRGPAPAPRAASGCRAAPHPDPRAAPGAGLGREPPAGAGRPREPGLALPVQQLDLRAPQPREPLHDGDPRFPLQVGQVPVTFRVLAEPLFVELEPRTGHDGVEPVLLVDRL